MNTFDVKRKVTFMCCFKRTKGAFRDHSQITSSKIWQFLTPPSPLVNFSNLFSDPPPKAGRWYQKIGAQVNLDQKDPENDDGEIRFSI